MNTFKELLDFGCQMLKDAGVEEAKNDSWLLMGYIFEIDRQKFLLSYNDKPEEEKITQYKKALQKRAEHIPLQYITHKQEFMGLEFYVDENVLIPRFDTEVLVEMAGHFINSEKKVLDMCTGSGCIAVSIASLYSPQSVTAADISKEALHVAQTNAGKNYVTDMISFVESDLFSNINEKFDVIVSNPPYIKSGDIATLMDEVRLYEPKIALDGNRDGLCFYREIAKSAQLFLNQDGMLFFEIGFDQAEEVTKILESNHYKNIKVIKDLAGLDRVVTAQV